mgnify:CR=1 FL=1|jgi:hypothetical protein
MYREFINDIHYFLMKKVIHINVVIIITSKILFKGLFTIEMSKPKCECIYN